MEHPSHIGKYEVLRLIGRGGMGCVYEARDRVLGRSVALKVMSAEIATHDEIHSRFLREARAVAALQHPNIVVVHELGDHNGDPFIAMEFLDGEPLDRILRSQKPLTISEKCDILIQVSNALHYAHERGVIHRDIKPGNIVCMSDGTVKVVDFGIAHMVDQTITKTGMVLGTLAYLAPEQLNCEGIDRRTDIFSLGVVLYQLFSGRLPFEGASTAETMMKILMQPAPPLPPIGDLRPVELQPIVDKALAKKRDERFQTCAELAHALSGIRHKFGTQDAAVFQEPHVDVSPRKVMELAASPTTPYLHTPGTWSKARVVVAFVMAGVLAGFLFLHFFPRFRQSNSAASKVVEKSHENPVAKRTDAQLPPPSGEHVVSSPPFSRDVSPLNSNKAADAPRPARTPVVGFPGGGVSSATQNVAGAALSSNSAMPKGGTAATSTDVFLTRLIIQSKEGELQVYIDGKSVGTARPENPFTCDVDPRVPHSLRVTKPGYSDFEERLDVAADASTASIIVRSPHMNRIGAPSPASMSESASNTAQKFRMLFLAGPSQFQVGYLILGKGSVRFEDDTGTHSFEVPFTEIVEAKNDSNLGNNGSIPWTFHIRVTSGRRYQFGMLDTLGRVIPPDRVVSLINQVRPKTDE